MTLLSPRRQILFKSNVFKKVNTVIKYWNRSRPCIILDSKIPRLVLEAFPKVLFLGQFLLDQNIEKGSNTVAAQIERRRSIKILNF